MTKILFFIDELAGGGAEKVLRTLVNHMDQTKFDITVHTVTYTDPSDLLAPGIRYRAINRCKTGWGKRLFSYWYRLCAELKWLYPLYIKDDYDVEVAYLEYGPTKIIAGSTNKKAKKIAWVHCDLAKKEGIADQAGKLKVYYDAYDQVVCVAETVKESFRNVIPTETEEYVLYNVNDEEEILRSANAFRVEREKVTTFLTVGRLSFEKGNDRLLEACCRLKKDGYDFCLWLVGDGQERPNLERLIQDYGLEEDVKFWGFQKNPYPYMVGADFLVVPSRYEGFSTVATEALILGKPVVTTPCSGMGELFGDSEFGLITEDSVEGIYTGIKKMLDDPQLRERYAMAAEQRGKRFSRKATVKQTETFFVHGREND